MSRHKTLNGVEVWTLAEPALRRRICQVITHSSMTQPTHPSHSFPPKSRSDTIGQKIIFGFVFYCRVCSSCCFRSRRITQHVAGIGFIFAGVSIANQLDWRFAVGDNISINLQQNLPGRLLKVERKGSHSSTCSCEI